MNKKQTQQFKIEEKILDLIYHHDDYTTSDLQGIVSAVVMDALNLKKNKNQPQNKPPKLVIIIDGGVIHNILTDSKSLNLKDIIIVDYDIDGAEEDQLKTISFPGAHDEQAYINHWGNIEIDPDFFKNNPNL